MQDGVEQFESTSQAILCLEYPLKNPFGRRGVNNILEHLLLGQMKKVGKWQFVTCNFTIFGSRET